MTRRPWTEEDTKLLRALAAQGRPASEIAVALDRDSRHINERAKRHGIAIRRVIADRVPWSKVDEAALRRRYPNESTAAIAADLGRTESAVYQHAYNMGLEKSEAYLATPEAGRMVRGQHDGRGAANRFTPGQAAWNKGVKGICGTHENCRRTQFRPGQMTGAARAKYKPIGTLRVTRDGALERKISDDPSIPAQKRWCAVARLVWEEVNGPIPSGHAVVFKPGRATVVEADITPGVLELVSRVELMRRNSRHTRYPREVNELIQLKGALNRKINNRTKRQEEDA